MDMDHQDDGLEEILPAVKPWSIILLKIWFLLVQ